LEKGFPHCGKLFSMVWKNREIFFHCVEKRARLAMPAGIPGLSNGGNTRKLFHGWFAPGTGQGGLP
jgi:hypothetical protein